MSRLVPFVFTCALLAACAGQDAGPVAEAPREAATGTPADAATDPAEPEPTAPGEAATAPGQAATEPDEAEPRETAGEGATPEALAFEAPLLDGGTFTGGDHDGRDVALWFWAPW